MRAGTLAMLKLPPAPGVAASASGPFSRPPIPAVDPAITAPVAASVSRPSIRPRDPPAGGSEKSSSGLASVLLTVEAK